ncbi:MAG: hypothetical protein M1369_04295 [Deinococcus sp.]|nr:hypothetical protein [Deinococcus sp.]
MNEELPNGPVVAALIAGGLGSATIGLMTVLAEASQSIMNALNWWNPAGPLTGKTLVGVIIFFVSWIVLHFIFRGKNVNFARAATIALILLGLGILGTFPPFFKLFAGE